MRPLSALAATLLRTSPGARALTRFGPAFGTLAGSGRGSPIRFSSRLRSCVTPRITARAALAFAAPFTLLVSALFPTVIAALRPALTFPTLFALLVPALFSTVLPMVRAAFSTALFALLRPLGAVAALTVIGGRGSLGSPLPAVLGCALAARGLPLDDIGESLTLSVAPLRTGFLLSLGCAFLGACVLPPLLAACFLMRCALRICTCRTPAFGPSRLVQRPDAHASTLLLFGFAARTSKRFAPPLLLTLLLSLFLASALERLLTQRFLALSRAGSAAFLFATLADHPQCASHRS